MEPLNPPTLTRLIGLPVVLMSGLAGCGERSGIAPAMYDDMHAAHACSAPEDSTLARSSGLSPSSHGVEGTWEIATDLEAATYLERVAERCSRRFPDAETSDGGVVLSRKSAGDVTVLSVQAVEPRRFAARIAFESF